MREIVRVRDVRCERVRREREEGIDREMGIHTGAHVYIYIHVLRWEREFLHIFCSAYCICRLQQDH